MAAQLHMLPRPAKYQTLGHHIVQGLLFFCETTQEVTDASGHARKELRKISPYGAT